MIDTKKHVQDSLCKALKEELDTYLQENGFRRSEKSLRYIRTCSECKQELRMEFVYKPTLDTDATARIYPSLLLRFPGVNKIASEMVGGIHGAVGRTDITLGQPLEFSVPKECRVRWFIYGQEQDYVLCVRSIQGYLGEWIIPFLDDFTTVNTLAEYFVTNDDRIPAPWQFYIYVASAYILLGQPSKAMEVLEAKYGQKGPRRDYAKAFEYVGKLLNK